MSPYAHQAVDMVTPYAQQAVDKVTPYAQQAVDKMSPYAHQAMDKVTPYAQQAVDKVSPYAHQAADRIAPLAATARQRGARAAHDAVERLTPVIDDAMDRVGPAVEAAREKVSDDLLPKLSEALSAAAGAPVVVEAAQRSEAALAAVKGELALPEKKPKRRWLKRLAVIAAVAGVAVVVARKFFGHQDADWQAARPTAPYAPPKPAASTPATTEPADTGSATAEPAASSAEPGDDPQAGVTAHAESLEANGEAVPDQPVEGGDDSVEPSDEESSR